MKKHRESHELNLKNTWTITENCGIILLSFKGCVKMNWIHKMKTVGAKRQAQCIAEDGEPKPRAKRNPKNIPDAWDDKVTSSWGDRCWKRLRKTPYHIVNV